MTNQKVYVVFENDDIYAIHRDKLQANQLLKKLTDENYEYYQQDQSDYELEEYKVH
jgi:hypothetical protein